MHDSEQERFMLGMDTSPRRSKDPMSVLTAIRDSANKRVSTSFVHDVDLFVTVRLLDETPAVCYFINFSQITDIQMSGNR